MGARISIGALAALCITAACGGGGGTDSGFEYGAGAFGAVRLLSHTPAADAVQVPLAASIQLDFDAPIALESLLDEDTWLRAAGNATNVAGAFARGAAGRVLFTPAQPLGAETDYTFQLSPLTCNVDGRILDDTVAFTFRTFDATPPAVLGADVAENATNVDRTRSFTIAISEAVKRTTANATTVYLRDGFGFRHAAAIVVDGALVTLDPLADLPGDRLFTLTVAAAVADRAGNVLASPWTRTFRTAPDTGSPNVASAWPAMHQTGVSPLVQPTFAFDESMDAASVEASSLQFDDEYGAIVPFSVAASPDQRTLRLVPREPLETHRRYTIAFVAGPQGATDVSGNALANTLTCTFTTGNDTTPPAIAASQPGGGETRVPGTAVLEVTFGEALDAAWVSPVTVVLTANGEPVSAVVEQPSPAIVRVTPVLPLPTGSDCVLTLRGGQDGLHDVAGNVPTHDLTLTFTTSHDAGEPAAMLLPPDGAVGIAPTARVVLVFDAPMDATTLNASTVRVTDDAGTPLPGTLTIGGDDRVVTFVPQSPLEPLTWYRTVLAGGSDGARRTTGNWFAADLVSRFRTGATTDTTAPTIFATVNDIDAARRQGLVLPPSGFTIDVTVDDAHEQWPDMGSVAVTLAGPGEAPAPGSLFAAATVGYGSFRVAVPATTPLAPGEWTLTVQARDLAGNAATSGGMSFRVAAPTTAILPFERTQVVWVRGDLDRDSNGRPDFADDMLRLGLATAGDPLGTNARVQKLVFDGVLAEASRLFGRGERGQPLDAGSVSLRFSTRQPLGVQHMQMALGGLDPEGSRTRGYGDESTGTLGRAYYDFRNGNRSERNVSTAPGLGVFPAEMWLYQTRLHIQVWPSYQTVFAQRFRPLCPDMGGTPAGAHALDAVVLAPQFDYETATAQQRARWNSIMSAADDWAVVIGIILAHEVGHSIGLVAPGPSPTGLFGDSSLHDAQAGAAQVMAPAVGYEAMTALDYAFRDVDLAYLRQRLLLP